MTAEFHRKIIEIQRAVRQRELHRLELERDLTLNQQRKEKNYEKLCSQLHALKQELLREELTTKRRIEGLFARVEILEKEYDATIKKTSQLRAKQKHIELRRSLSKVLHSSYYDHRTSVTKSHQEILRANSVSKSTQTDLDANFFHDANNFQRYTAATHLVIQPQNPFYYAGSHHQLLPSSVDQCYPRTDSTFDLNAAKNSSQTFERQNSQREENVISSNGSYTNGSRSNRVESELYTSPDHSRYGPNADPLTNRSSFRRSHNSKPEVANDQYFSARKYSDPEISYLAEEEDAATELYISGLLKQRRMSTPALHSNKEQQSYPIKSNLEKDNNRILERIPDEPYAIKEGEIIQRSSSSDNASTISTKVEVPSKGVLKSGKDDAAIQTPVKAKPLKLVSFVSPKQEGNVAKGSRAINETETSNGNKDKLEVSCKTDEVSPRASHAENAPELKVAKQIAEREVVSGNYKASRDSSESDYSGIEEGESREPQERSSIPVEPLLDKVTKSPVASAKEEPKDKILAATPTTITKQIKDQSTEAYHPKNQQAITSPAIKAEQQIGNPNVKRSSAETEKLDKQATENMVSTGKVNGLNLPSTKKEEPKNKPAVGGSAVDAEQPNAHINSNVMNTNLATTQIGNEPANEYSKTHKTDRIQTNIIKKKTLDDDFFDEEVPLKESSAYQRMLGINPTSVSQSKGFSTAGERIGIVSSDFSPTPMARATQRWGASAEGSGIGARPSDTESIDSVEAAIQASMSAQKVQQPEKENTDFIDYQAAVTLQPSPEKAKPKEVTTKESNKAPINIKLDSESESYSMSAGGVSEDDDFDFST